MASQRPRARRAPGSDPLSPRALPGHERYRPDPAGHLAGRRAVRHAGPLSRLRHGVAPVLQAAVALRGVPRRRRRDPVARPRLLGWRRHRHVPRRDDARLTWSPARVIPPRDSVSPLERSEGASPHHAANDGALGNLEKSPASAASRNAVATSTPFTRHSASTVGAHSGREAASTTLARAPSWPRRSGPPRPCSARRRPRRGLVELDRPRPPPVRLRPVRPAAPGRRCLVEHQAVPEKELGHALPGALQVVAGVLQGAGESRAASVRSSGTQPRRRCGRRGAWRATPPAPSFRGPVGRGPVHLGDGAHGAVDAERPQGAAEVEAGRPLSYTALGDSNPSAHSATTRSYPNLARDTSPVMGSKAHAEMLRVDVETDGCDIIGHGGPLSVACGARPRLALDHRPTTIELQGEGLPMFNSYRLVCLACGPDRGFLSRFGPHSLRVDRGMATVWPAVL